MKFAKVVAIYAPNSTRAEQYFRTIRPLLQRFAAESNTRFHEIALDNVPFFDAIQVIKTSIKQIAADQTVLVVAAGGDGTANVVVNALMSSETDATLAVVPLGNSNDFAGAINGRANNPITILSSETLDFSPLHITINNEHVFYATQYVGLGASAHIAKILNSAEVRAIRRRGKTIMRTGLYGARNYAKIFRQHLNQEIMPPLTRDFFPTMTKKNQTPPDKNPANEIMFMLGAIGTYFHPRPGDFHAVPDQFWAHAAYLSGKVTRDIPKLASWVGYRVPGCARTKETLQFREPTDILIQNAGDEIVLQNVREISVKRSAKTLKIFSPRKKQLEKIAANIANLT